MLRPDVLHVSGDLDRDVESRAPLVRAATAADLPRIERLLSDSSLPVDGVAGALDGFVVAVDETSDRGDVIIGVAGLERCGDAVALLRSVAVDERWRGRRVGALLVERLVADARAGGLAALYLLTTTAERWFPAFGFVRVERSAVPEAIRGTSEFRDVCPSSATVMALALGGDARA